MKTPRANHMSDHTTDSGSPAENLLPRGFRFSGTASGLKISGKKDLALVVADHSVVAAGVYTQNQVVAAPVVICRKKTPSDEIRAVVVNSGNANACTGARGIADAEAMCAQVANLIGCTPNQVLLMSTGVIGVQLEMDKVEEGIANGFSNLSASIEEFNHACDAICTTDQARKTATRTVVVSDKPIRIVGMAKGAGMIAPNMATMLAMIVTDAILTPNRAQSMLKQSCDKSFNRISVDGHTSTNDTVLMLASGDSGIEITAENEVAFQQELDTVFTELAKQIVLDGEGAKHIMAIQVDGAETDDAAFNIAKTVAASPLVKTAITGGDPNWGRIISAAGYADAVISAEQTSLEICGVTIYKDGTPVAFDAGTLSKKMQANREVPIVLSVGSGQGTSKYWSSDLTTDYVTFNSEYTT